jgi:type II secretory pathway pseudopilin PulG
MATPGKRLCGLYVTDTGGHRLSFGRALWRNVAALLSYATLYIGFFMAGFTGRKQALHDMLAGTIVHRQPGSSAGMAIGIAVAGFIVIAIIGILAAIAIPAYQDFTFRAKTSAVYSAMSSAKVSIAEYNLEKNAWPATWEQAGMSDPMGQLGAREREVAQSIRLGKDGEVTASIKIGGASGEIRITPKRTGNDIVWTCTASKEIWKYIIATCRN